MHAKTANTLPTISTVGCDAVINVHVAFYTSKTNGTGASEVVDFI